MNVLRTIFAAEFTRKLRSRAYLVGTLAGMLAIAFAIEAPPLLSRAFAADTNALVLAGPRALTTPAIKLLEPEFRIAAVVTTLPPHPSAPYLDAHGHAASALALARTANGLRATAYVRDSAEGAHIGRALAPLGVALGTGLALERIVVLSHVDLHVKPVDARFDDEGRADAARGVAYALIFVLYIATILNSQAVLTSIAEEKTNRIAELLVATVRPSVLLTAKVLAAGALGFVQIGLWIATGFALLPLSLAQGAAPGVSLPAAISVSPAEVGAFFAFFVLGYLQYAMLYAAAGSLINRTEDIAGVSGPLIFPVVGAFLVAQYALVAPSAPASAVASFVPLIAPFVMFARVAVTSVPAWQIALSLGVNLAAAVALAIAAGKVYRVGMLLYGRAPRFSQILAALRA